MNIIKILAPFSLLMLSSCAYLGEELLTIKYENDPGKMSISEARKTVAMAYVAKSYSCGDKKVVIGITWWPQDCNETTRDTIFAGCADMNYIDTGIVETCLSAIAADKCGDPTTDYVLETSAFNAAFLCAIISDGRINGIPTMFF